MLFDLCPAFFDGVEVRGIGRQVEQFRSGSRDSLPNTLDFVSGKIVHHDNIAWLELRTQSMIQEREKDIRIGRRFNGHRGDPTLDADSAEHRQSSPAGWGGVVQPLTALHPAVASCHLRRDTAFIDEDQVLRLNVCDARRPLCSFCLDPQQILLGRSQAFF